jgi:phosphoribosylglycinamide formyltransferase-1
LRKIAVLFSGEGSNLEYILSTIHTKECQVVKVLTDNPVANGINIAKKYAIPVDIVDPAHYKCREDFDREVVKLLQKCQPELTVLAGFMRILTPVFTEQIKAINLHPSLLPRHKGLHAIEKSYADPFPEGGVTIHRVSSELDGGEIILQKKLHKTGLSFEEYEEKIKGIEKETLVEAIKKILIMK